MEHAGRIWVIDVQTIVVEKFIDGILEQSFEEGRTAIFQQRCIEAESTFFEKMPVFRKPFEGVEAKEPGAGVLVGADPPSERGAAGHAEFQVVNGFFIESFAADHMLVQLYAVIVV